MIHNRLLYISLAMATFTAAAYAVGRRTQKTEKQRQKTELRSWEEEGGNLAPAEAAAIARPAPAA